MLWIIFYHAVLGNMNYSINYINEQNLSLSKFYLFGIGGKMAVATFFFIAGFLACFTALK
jgi:peptidoglycan/LPS O-acetylase OafA/YrhL